MLVGVRPPEAVVALMDVARAWNEQRLDGALDSSAGVPICNGKKADIQIRNIFSSRLASERRAVMRKYLHAG